MCVLGGRDGRGGWARPRRFIWPAARSTRWKLDSLAIVAALVGQGRDDARGRGLGEAGLVGHLDDAGPLGCGERVRRRGAVGVRPAVAAREAVACLPTLHRARVDAGQSAGRDEPGAAGAGLLDGVQQGPAIFQAGHASSPLRKIADSFFLGWQNELATDPAFRCFPPGGADGQDINPRAAGSGRGAVAYAEGLPGLRHSDAPAL